MKPRFAPSEPGASATGAPDTSLLSQRRARRTAPLAARWDRAARRRLGIALILLTGAFLLTGCSGRPTSTDTHDGHRHRSPSDASAPEDSCCPPANGAGADTVRSNLFCREHRVPEAECGICHPERVAALQPGQSLQVRLPAPESARLAGVEIAPAALGPGGEWVECLAELSFDQNRLTQVVAPVAGILQEVTADQGDRVSEKQVLARLWSAAIAEAVARAALTHQTLERERRLRALRVIAERDLQQAEVEHQAACQHARTLGFSEEEIHAFGTRTDEPVYLDMRAPFAGEIIERTAVRGALVEAGRPLFTLADRSTVWAMLRLPESALHAVREGQAVELRVDAFPDRVFPGTLTRISAEVDARTRLVRARAEVPNPDGQLRAGMFGRARVWTKLAAAVVRVPAAALQRVEGQSLVFVRRADDLFEARVVRPGRALNGLTEVLAGLQPDEPVAVRGAFALKSQLLLSRLGAGCAEE